MGYQTSYSLKVELYANGKRAEHPLADDIIAELRQPDSGAEYCLDKDGSTQESGKWYEHESDLKKFSAAHAGVLFTLHGEGEENEDIWNKYFLKRDQVASTEQIAEALGSCSFAVREALLRLQKVGRVAEIHANLWHLE